MIAAAATAVASSAGTTTLAEELQDKASLIVEDNRNLSQLRGNNGNDGNNGNSNKKCIPDATDLRYGAVCVEKEDPTEPCDGDSEDDEVSNNVVISKGRKIALYYDSTDPQDDNSCVPAQKLNVDKCEDHNVVEISTPTTDAVGTDVANDAGCAVIEKDTKGCNTKEMCAQRHKTGKLCPGCKRKDKLHACAGCPNNTEIHRALLSLSNNDNDW